mmetsp:Transcript_7448/g.6781  ORF Transcript_7448/g.6781 Transcript_7448/m.6781 type:complete len:100 (-) Transcript_7448:61-360(-)
MNFKNFKEKANEAYKDFLRVIFSRKFVKNHQLYTKLALLPIFMYMITTEAKMFATYWDSLTLVKYNDQNEELYKVVSSKIDKLDLSKHALHDHLRHYDR